MTNSKYDLGVVKSRFEVLQSLGVPSNVLSTVFKQAQSYDVDGINKSLNLLRGNIDNVIYRYIADSFSKKNALINTFKDRDGTDLLLANELSDVYSERAYTMFDNEGKGSNRHRVFRSQDYSGQTHWSTEDYYDEPKEGSYEEGEILIVPRYKATELAWTHVEYDGYYLIVHPDSVKEAELPDIFYGLLGIMWDRRLDIIQFVEDSRNKPEEIGWVYSALKRQLPYLPEITTLDGLAHFLRNYCDITQVTKEYVVMGGNKVKLPTIRLKKIDSTGPAAFVPVPSFSLFPGSPDGINMTSILVPFMKVFGSEIMKPLPTI